MIVGKANLKFDGFNQSRHMEGVTASGLRVHNRHVPVTFLGLVMADAPIVGTSSITLDKLINHAGSTHVPL